MIPESWLADLKRRVDLVELGRRYGVAWETRGREAKACCPFHEEDTPSFVAMVEPRKGSPRFHCYGCSRSWDAVAFVMERSGQEFHQALEELAGGASMTVPARSETEAEARERAARRVIEEQVVSANAAAQEYFVRALQAARPEAEAARAYLEDRGLGPAVEPWGIGYAPPAGAGRRAGLLEWLDRRGLGDAAAVAACLAQPQQEGGGLYVWHRNRITFPVRDRRGRVVAHVGRALEHDQVPKYLNPRETPVYVKSECLFGIHEAAGAIRQAREAVVVEGQPAVITPWLHGLRNIVATGGTAFGEAHLAALRAAGAERLVLCFDGDAAGIRAAQAAVDLCTAEQMDCRVAALPAGADPDDYVRAGEAG